MPSLDAKIAIVFAYLRSLPDGHAVTYAAVAREAGLANARNIGWILECNHQPDEVPCFKVVRSDGRLTDGYKFGGPRAQRSRLLTAGVKFRNGRVAPESLIR